MSQLTKDNDGQKVIHIKRNSRFKQTGLKLKKGNLKRFQQNIEFPKINNSYIACNPLSFILLKFFTINGQLGLEQRRVEEKENQQKICYFITQEQKDQYIINSTGKLINLTKYKQIDLNQFDQRMKNLIESINLISQNLDEQFFDELTNIIKLVSEQQVFSQKEQNLTTIINNIIQIVKKEEIRFQHIKEWAQIKQQQLNQEVMTQSELEQQKNQLNDFLTQLISIILQNLN